MRSAATPSPKRRPSPTASPPSSSQSPVASSSSSNGRSRVTVIVLAVAVLSGSSFQLGLMVGMDAGRRQCAEGGSGGASPSSSSSSSRADTGHLDDRMARRQSPCSCDYGVASTNQTTTTTQQQQLRSPAALHAPIVDENARNEDYQASSAETSAPDDGNDADASADETDSRQQQRLFRQPKASHLIAAYEYVKRNDFVSVVDTGVPVDPDDAQKDDVLILYTSKSSVPNRTESSDANASPTEKAVENCLTLRVVLTEQDVESNCIAIMGHPEESYHVHRFHRIHITYSKEGGRNIEVGSHVPLTPVSRFVETRGDLRDEVIPGRHVMDRYIKELVGYLSQLQDTLDRLRPIAKRAAGGADKGGTIVAMAVNKGQSELLLNFVCAARSRNLDLSHVLVFATDRASAKLASGLGVHVFDVRGAFGKIPTQAAEFYGDDDFARIVASKIYCVHLLVLLGHNVLLHDVDVVWYRDPLEYFAPDHQQKPNKSLEQFDMVFQDDGNTSPRFAPFFANTGVYFVRSNARTVHLYSYLVRMGDVLREVRCDQEMIAAYLAEHVSLTGLRVKVLGAHTEDGMLFPGGFHYHTRGDYMMQLLRGDHKPYAFHMSWTSNKIDKRKYFDQMGEWRVQPICLDGKQDLVKVPATRPANKTAAAAEACCSAEPIVKCHYRDKPSIVDCRDSPSIHGDGDPFWPKPFNRTATAAA